MGSSPLNFINRCIDSEAIINNPLSFFEEIGLSNHLGQSRSNGLNSLRKKIKSIATDLSNK